MAGQIPVEVEIRSTFRSFEKLRSGRQRIMTIEDAYGVVCRENETILTRINQKNTRGMLERLQINGGT
ncbi:MAG: hypothetical protein EZS28_048681, partial [Streblomastix strix]